MFKTFILEAIIFSSYCIMPSETDLTQIGTVNLTMRSCRQLQCAIMCERYIKENSVCIGYYMSPQHHTYVCQCTLLVTGGTGASVPLDGKKYMYTGKVIIVSNLFQKLDTPFLCFYGGSRLIFSFNLPMVSPLLLFFPPKKEKRLLQSVLQFHPMRIISVVLICDTWEICLLFCKQIPDRKFLKLSLPYPPLKFLHFSVWIQ